MLFCYFRLFRSGPMCSLPNKHADRENLAKILESYPVGWNVNRSLVKNT